MVGHELTIEQFEATQAHTRDQPDQRHFRRVGCPRKHAFAAKGATNCEAIKPADQPFSIPAFDTVRQSALV